MMTLKTEKEIQKFFHGRDASLKLFNSLRSLIERHRSPKIVVNNTQISFGEDYRYLWVWLPQTWIKKRRENSITLTILTGKRIKSDKIEESVQPRKGYWTHHIIIENGKDMDRELEGLIQESFKFYEERLKNKKKQKAARSKKAE